MGNDENCVSADGSSKKRAFGSSNTLNQQAVSPRKRSVLGELSANGGNVNLGFKDVCTPEMIVKKTLKKIAEKKDGQLKKGHSPLIYQCLRSMEAEEKRRPLSNYMEKVQTDITIGMREILVDWLVEVADEYKLISDTLYLAVSYIDRYLSSHALSRNKLQLLGVSCMLIASKHEEITPPRIEDFCYITDNTYVKEEVVEMEKDILKFLNFEVSNPTTKTFIRSFLRAANENPTPNLKFEILVCYLAELSLLNYGFLRFNPSMIAASAIFLSNFTIQPEKHPWSLALQLYSGYEAFELVECVLALRFLQLCKGFSSQAVRQKYMHPKFKCVAELRPPSAIPPSYFQGHQPNKC
ncbi:hypothetical protein ACET3Z_030596 [Daucus carota]